MLFPCHPWLSFSHILYHIGLTALTYSCGAAPAGDGPSPRPPSRAHRAPIIQALQRHWGAALPPPCSLLARGNPPCAQAVYVHGNARYKCSLSQSTSHRYLCLHIGSPVPRLLQENREYRVPRAAASGYPARRRRVGRRPVATSGQSIRPLHLSRSPIQVSDWLQRYASSQISHSEHGISPRAPRSGVRVPREGTGAGSDAGPIPQVCLRGCRTHQSLRSYPERPQHWPMEAYHRPVVSARS